MNYAYALVSAKDRTYSGRLPRLVSLALKKSRIFSEKKSGTSQCRVNRYGRIRLTASAVREWSGTSLRSTRACTPCMM